MPTPTTAQAASQLPTDPKKLALLYKAYIEAPGSNGLPYFHVQPDGRVKGPEKGGYVPPWAWALKLPGTMTIDANGKGTLTDLGDKLVRPGSDPQSAWRSMYQGSSAFRRQSEWSTEDGTYDGHLDWGTIIGTAAAGGLIGAGIAAAATAGTVAGGTTTAATIPTTMGVTGAEFGGAAATTAVPAAVAGGSTVAAIPTTLGVTGAEFGGPAATSVVPAAVADTVPTTLGVTGAEFGGDATTGALPTSADTAHLVAGHGIENASTLDKVANVSNKVKTTSDLLDAAGQGVGDATDAAEKNRLTAGDMALRVENQRINTELQSQQVRNQTQQTNTQGQSAYETALMARARQEQTDRQDALKNVYRQSYATNRTAGPFNKKGLTPYSPEYLQTLKDLQTQGSSKLSTVSPYDSSKTSALKPYTPVEYEPVKASFDLDEFMKQYGTPSTLEKVGNWVSPTLSILGKVAGYWK